jgi:mannose-6-phosphate isomerase-like protein (cupin superfamily)
MSLVDALRKLVGEAELYIDQIVQGNPVKIGFRLTDTGEEATLSIEEGLAVVEGLDSPDLLLTMERGALDGMAGGEANYGALIGRSRASETRPINYNLLNPGNAPAAVEALKSLGFLFTPGRVKSLDLRRELAGEAHGAHPIPLVYHEGLRFSWYNVERGETLNEEGERDSYPQLIVVIRGRGVLTLEEDAVELVPGRAVYIPVDSVHRVHAKEDLEVLWLAWKTPLI